MNISEALTILKARYKIILATLLVIVGVTAAVSLLLPKMYKATVSLVLNYKGVDPVTGLTLPAQLMPGYMQTQVDIINSTRTALKVIDDLHLLNEASVAQQFASETGGKGDIRIWLAESLTKHLEVTPSRESSVLGIGFKSQSPDLSVLIANGYAAAYQQVSLQLRVEPSMKASGYFSDQTKLLREKLENTQKNLASYQQAKGFVNIDGKLDLESTRLAELSTQLAIAQAQLMEASSRSRQVRNGAENSPDIAGNPFIQSQKANLSTAEGKLADLSQRLDKNHPQYQAAKSEVEKLRSNLDEQVKVAGGSIAGSARIAQARVGDLQAALAAQKARVLDLSTARNEVKVLSNEMETAQKAYEAASQRYSQTNMESQFNQTDSAVLTPATRPIRPTGPNLLLNMVIAILLSLVFGSTFALIAESMDRRIRSAAELARLVPLPVLGVLELTSPI